jgi:acyl carrier protein
MTEAQILAELRSMMIELFDIQAERVVPEARLIDDLDLDSIDAIDMAARLQELTGRRVPEDALKAIRTISDVVDLVHRELAAQGTSSTHA